MVWPINSIAIHNIYLLKRTRGLCYKIKYTKILIARILQEYWLQLFWWTNSNVDINTKWAGAPASAKFQGCLCKNVETEAPWAWHCSIHVFTHFALFIFCICLLVQVPFATLSRWQVAKLWVLSNEDILSWQQFVFPQSRILRFPFLIDEYIWQLPGGMMRYFPSCI